MVSISRNPKDKELFEVQLVSREVKQPNFKPIPEVAYKNDLANTLSIIPPKVVMVQDIHKFYNCKVGGIGDMKIKKVYNKICVNEVSKEEYNIVEKKGLTCALEFPTIFKMEWIRLVLHRIHDGYLWLEG